MLPFYIYILKCSDNSYYVGHCDDIDRRLAEHAAGAGCDYTAARLPVEIVFLEEFESRTEALELEHKIKRWSRKKKEALMAKQWEQLKDLSKKKFNL